MWIPRFADSLTWKPALATLLLTLLNACLFSVVNRSARVTRSIVSLPVFLYLFTVGAIPALHTGWQSQILVLVFQFVLLLLLRTYRKETTSEESFLCTLLLCLSAFVLPDMLLLVPVLWLAFLLQGAMNIKAFFASLIAVMLTAVYFFVAVFLGWIQPAELSACITRSNHSLLLNLPLFVSTLLLIVSSVFAVVCNLRTYQQQRSIVTTYLTCLILPMLLCFTMCFFPSLNAPSFLALSAYLAACIHVYFFSTQQSVFAGSCFLAFILLFAVSYALYFFL